MALSWYHAHSHHYSTMLIPCADFLALANIPPRPRPNPDLQRLQDVPPHLQQSPAHRLWFVRARPPREDYRERLARHSAVQSCARCHSCALPTAACWSAGHCTSQEAASCRRDHIRQHSTPAHIQESYRLRHSCSLKKNSPSAASNQGCFDSARHLDT